DPVTPMMKIFTAPARCSRDPVTRDLSGESTAPSDRDDGGGVGGGSSPPGSTLRGLLASVEPTDPAGARRSGKAEAPELAPRGDSELAEDVAQVGLDRARAQEQLR